MNQTILGVEYQVYLWLLLLAILFSLAFNIMYPILKDKNINKKMFITATLKVAGAVFVVLAVVAIVFKGVVY